MKIRAKAIEEGIPYQSLISMLIHKYNEGKLSIHRPTKKSTRRRINAASCIALFLFADRSI